MLETGIGHGQSRTLGMGFFNLFPWAEARVGLMRERTRPDTHGMMFSFQGQFLKMNKHVQIPPIQGMPAVVFLGLNVLHLCFERSPGAS